MFNVIMRAATGLPFRDTQCGFKLFRKDAARVIFPRQLLDGFGFDVEDLLIAHIHGFKVVEVPVRWDNVEGTKVSALTGARAFWDLAGGAMAPVMPGAIANSTASHTCSATCSRVWLPSISFTRRDSSAAS